MIKIKYVILCDSDNVEPFVIPRQLYKINGETIIERTIRQLKENNIKNIIVTSHDERFDNLGAIRYEPKRNEYNCHKEGKKRGYWLNAFPQELIKEPITFLLGDVYFSDKAIKTIVESETTDVLFFCTDIKKGKGLRYIKHHDEPLGFKVVNCDLFKEHIEKLKDMFDKGLTKRHPIAWELYRSINNIDVNTHLLTDNYIGINDITCDIDNVEDVQLIENQLYPRMTIKIIKQYNDKLLNRKVKINELLNVTIERGKYIIQNKYAELIEIENNNGKRMG